VKDASKMRSDRRTVRPQYIDEDCRGAVLSAGANSVPLVSQSQMTLSWLFVLTRHTVSSRKHLPDVDQPCVSILDSSFAVRMMIAVGNQQQHSKIGPAVRLQRLMRYQPGGHLG
jgi:hypothetical protein